MIDEAELVGKPLTNFFRVSMFATADCEFRQLDSGRWFARISGRHPQGFRRGQPREPLWITAITFADSLSEGLIADMTQVAKGDLIQVAGHLVSEPYLSHDGKPAAGLTVLLTGARAQIRAVEPPVYLAIDVEDVEDVPEPDAEPEPLP